MQSVEDVEAVVVRGGRIGDIGRDVRDGDFGADDDSRRGIAHDAANLRLKAGLSQNESWNESQY